MKLSVAICDDDLEICSQLELFLEELLRKKSISFEIDVFYTGESLCKGLDAAEYDLIFLDIQLPKMNGVEIGHYIREARGDNLVQIAYISSQQEYAMELFYVRPIQFLIKPLQESSIEKVIDTYITITGEKAGVFQYKKGHEHHKAEIYRIMYFVRNGRKITMRTVDGTDEFYGSLESIYEWAEKERFLFIHKSYMVNCRYIKKIGYEQLVMMDGAEFPISQSRRKEIRERYRGMEEL